MFKAMGIRLLFILGMAVFIRVGGGLLSSHHAKPEGPTVEVRDRFGDRHRLPAQAVADRSAWPTSGKARSSFDYDDQRDEISFEPGQPMVDPRPRN